MTSSCGQTSYPWPTKCCPKGTCYTTDILSIISFLIREFPDMPILFFLRNVSLTNVSVFGKICMMTQRGGLRTKIGMKSIWEISNALLIPVLGPSTCIFKFFMMHYCIQRFDQKEKEKILLIVFFFARNLLKTIIFVSVILFILS